MNCTGLFRAAAIALALLVLVPVQAQTPPAPTPQPAPAPAPTPPPPNKVDGLELPADMVIKATENFVAITAKTDGNNVKFLVIGTVPDINSKVFGKTVIVGLTPGATIFVYANTVIVKDGKAIITDHARTQITVNGQAPAPPTPPNGAVQPPSPPANGAKPYIVAVVYDQSKTTQKLADVLNSQTLRGAFTEKDGYLFRILDINSQEVKDAELMPQVVKAGGEPALIVMDAKGVVKLRVRVPATEQDFIRAVQDAVK